MRSTAGAYGEKFDSDSAPACTVPPWTFCASAARDAELARRKETDPDLAFADPLEVVLELGLH
jgi:hypothetical protein